MSNLKAFIDTYIDGKFTIFNSSLPDSVKVKKIISELDLEKISAKDSNINYHTWVGNTSEAGRFDSVPVRVLFVFSIAGKNADRYTEIVDNYVWKFRRLFRKGAALPLGQYSNAVATGMLINAVDNVSMQADENTVQGTFFKPVLEITLMITDT